MTNSKITPTLPDVVVEEFRGLLAASDNVQWAQGDFIEGALVELHPYYAHEYEELKSSRAFRAWVIKSLSKKTGADKSTLRDRHNMARFFSQADRDKYDVLTYHQLRACKSAGEKWEHYAAWAIESADDWGGNPAPVSEIRKAVKFNGDAPPPWIYKWERILDLAEGLVKDKGAPLAVRLVARLILHWNV